MHRALKYPYRYSLRNFIVFGSNDCDFSGWKWNKCGTAEIYPFLNYNLALSGAPKFCAVGALKELLFSSAGWHSPLLVPTKARVWNHIEMRRKRTSLFRGNKDIFMTGKEVVAQTKHFTVKKFCLPFLLKYCNPSQVHNFQLLGLSFVC